MFGEFGMGFNPTEPGSEKLWGAGNFAPDEKSDVGLRNIDAARAKRKSKAFADSIFEGEDPEGMAVATRIIAEYGMKKGSEIYNQVLELAEHWKLLTFNERKVLSGVLEPKTGRTDADKIKREAFEAIDGVYKTFIKEKKSAGVSTAEQKIA